MLISNREMAIKLINEIPESKLLYIIKCKSAKSVNGFALF